MGSRQLIHVLIMLFCVLTKEAKDIKVRTGQPTKLYCDINRSKCGDVHSIKWYKDNNRVYVYSPVSNFKNSEGSLVDRAVMSIDNNTALLSFSPTRYSDEGEYKCEVTYLDVHRGCPVVKTFHLRTLERPRYQRIVYHGNTSTNALVGPIHEGSQTVLSCESGGGRPVPKIEWYFQNRLIEGEESISLQSNISTTVEKQIRFRVGREHLGDKIYCRVSNEAMINPMEAFVQLDVVLKPQTTVITGKVDDILEGESAHLQCISKGARPAAVLSWYNGSKPLHSDQVKHVASLLGDGTYVTQSKIKFPVTRLDHNHKVICKASNEVTEVSGPQTADTKLNVKFAPFLRTRKQLVQVKEGDHLNISCEYEGNPRYPVTVSWMKDHALVNTNSSRYITREESAWIIIRSVKMADEGNYTCIVRNSIGEGRLQTPVRVTVLTVPLVRLTMFPRSPVSEARRQNVTLHCEVVRGKPDTLLRVQWLMDGMLLTELPQCQPPNTSLCGLDPNKLILEYVNREFEGNYSCVGFNKVGGSPRAVAVPLEVLYPPGEGKVVINSELIYKDKEATFSCDVGNFGKPPATEFIWYIGNSAVVGKTSKEWRVNPVILGCKSNISCQARNSVGTGTRSLRYIEVLARPRFIQQLPVYTGSTRSARYVELVCQVECFPRCQVVWLHGDIPIRNMMNGFSVQEREVGAETARNTFPSLLSALSFNPHEIIISNGDQVNLTCEAEGAGGQPPIRSSTVFRLEYPPEVVQLSSSELTVIENTIPGPILCSADGFPQPQIQWRFNGHVIQSEPLLRFSEGVHRGMEGLYVCEAWNIHGSTSSAVNVKVVFPATCSLHSKVVNTVIHIRCEGVGSPNEFSYSWSKDNKTVEKLGNGNTLVLESTDEMEGTYSCFINNSVGGSSCNTEVTDQGLSVLAQADVFIGFLGISAVVLTSLMGILLVLWRRKQRRKQRRKYNR